MTTYYTVTVDDEGEPTTYRTTQLHNLDSILAMLTGGAHDFIDLDISDGEVSVTIEVAT
jgi:hypothetical protein